MRLSEFAEGYKILLSGSRTTLMALLAMRMKLYLVEDEG